MKGIEMRLSNYLAGCAAVAALALSLGSVSASADTFALVTINQQALFFNQINEGAEAAAKAAGAKLVIFNANNQAASKTLAQAPPRAGVDKRIVQGLIDSLAPYTEDCAALAKERAAISHP